jgi:hypothetical protein
VGSIASERWRDLEARTMPGSGRKRRFDLQPDSIDVRVAVGNEPKLLIQSSAQKLDDRT